MKNSLFKRAIAAVATVPLAFTQCLTFANAETNEPIQLTQSAPSADNEVVTLESLLRIAPDKTEATWYYQINQLLVSGVLPSEGTINVNTYKDAVVKKAGKYKELAEYVFTLLKDVKYEITGKGDVVITGTLEDPDFSKDIPNTPGAALKDFAEEYNITDLSAFDLSSVKAGGDFKITLGTSALSVGSDFDIKTEYTNADGTIGFGELPEYAIKKLEEVRQIILNGIEEQSPAEVPDETKAEAKDSFNAEFDKSVASIKKLINYEDRLLNSTADFAADNVEGVIALANGRLANTRFKFRIPATPAEIAPKQFIVNLANSILAKAGGAVSFSVDDIAQFAETFYAVSLDLNAGNAIGEAYFDDAELDEVKTWVESQGNTFVSSKKKVTVKGDYAKGVNTGDIDVKVERVLVTAPGTTTVTTTSATTTETTSVSTTETTSSATTSETTSSTSSETTSSKTTSTETTSSKTTSTETTSSKTTSSATTSETTSSTSSETTSSKTTSTETTSSKTTSSATTSETTSSTSSETTSSKTTSSETTSSKTTSTETTTETTSSATTSVTTEAPEATTSFVKSYVTYTTETAFYINDEAEFDKSQFKNVVLHKIYVKGYEGQTTPVEEFEVTENITDSVTFGSATPSTTYDEKNETFKYDVVLNDAEGNALKTADGENATVTAYIALMGDVNLDNLVDSNDASQILSYYARLSTNASEDPTSKEILSKSPLVLTATDEYDEFAAFLADVHTNADTPVTRLTRKNGRLIDSNDASRILAYYAKQSSSDYADKTSKEIWNEVLKKN